MPTGIKEWLWTITVPLLGNVPEELHGEIIEKIAKKLESRLEYKNDKYIADYVRLRFIAYKE